MLWRLRRLDPMLLRRKLPRLLRTWLLRMLLIRVGLRGGCRTLLWPLRLSAHAGRRREVAVTASA